MKRNAWLVQPALLFNALFLTGVILISQVKISATADSPLLAPSQEVNAFRIYCTT